MVKKLGWLAWAAAVALVLFVGFSPSWGACRSMGIQLNRYAPDVCNGAFYQSSCERARDCYYPPTNQALASNAGCYTGYISVANLSYSCGQNSNGHYINVGGSIACCNNQAEVDSVDCAVNPSLPKCIVTTDTTLFACSSTGTGTSGLFRLSCVAQNGVVVSCNGKTDVDINTDGVLVREMSGTCAANGFENGIVGGASADSTQPQSAECFAVLGSKCAMRDRNSGNTYTCDCDGSCDYAMRQQALGSGCVNPYPQPGSSQSINMSSWNEAQSAAQQSSAQQPGSSASEPGSSASGDTPMSDFEYDYTDVLENIRANTQYTGTQLNQLNSKASTANSLLERIANKNVSPVVNVDARDTINVNVELNADTAHAPAAILGLLEDKMSGGEPNTADTAGMGAQLDAYLSGIDSIVNEGVPDMSDSIGGAVAGYRGAYSAFKDSMANSAWNDSVTRWEGQLLNNGVITGDGSDNCPQVLQRTFNVQLGIGGTIVFGPLGKYLCAVVPGANVTFWALARVVIRALVSIACMMWIFKAVMGIDGGSNEED